MLRPAEHIVAEPARVVQGAVDGVDYERVVRMAGGRIEHFRPHPVAGVEVNSRQCFPLRIVREERAPRLLHAVTAFDDPTQVIQNGVAHVAIAIDLLDAVVAVSGLGDRAVWARDSGRSITLVVLGDGQVQ